MQWTESVGLTLVGRDQSSMQLRTPGDQILNFTILQLFPFTYESKRMGIIVRVSCLLFMAKNCFLFKKTTRLSLVCVSGWDTHVLSSPFFPLVLPVVQTNKRVQFPLPKENLFFSWTDL